MNYHKFDKMEDQPEDMNEDQLQQVYSDSTLVLLGDAGCGK
jgi:hypothetical protein